MLCVNGHVSIGVRIIFWTHAACTVNHIKLPPLSIFFCLCPSHHQVASPSPDRTLFEANAAPIDYSKQELIKQEVVKQEAVELTVTDSASGTPPVFTIYYYVVLLSVTQSLVLACVEGNNVSP